MAEEKEKKIQLVKMVRLKDLAGDGPLNANVHPNEVENYKNGGWQVKGE